MFRLTREVRFSVNSKVEPETSAQGNGFGGFPSMLGLGRYFMLQVTLAGPLQPRSSYLLNIKEIDHCVRDRIVPCLRESIASNPKFSAERAALEIHKRLRDAWPGVVLERAKLFLTPFFSVTVITREASMVRLSQKFEFSATHRLHNPKVSEEENRLIFGKCNNPHGHGHNYVVEVTLVGEPDANGLLIGVPECEKIVTEAAIDRFDHKNINVEIPEFRELIPTVENIAMTIYRLLKPRFKGLRAKLASVTVWETPKTWCEYSERV